MAVFTYKCPNCTGPLALDPATGSFKCDYCDGVFTKDFLDSLDDKAEASPHTGEVKTDVGDGETVLYTCPSCGAEVVTDSTTAATLCYYCHNPVVLTGRLDREFTPDYIIPFTVTKDTAKKTFDDWVKSKKYVPAGFYDPSSVDSVTGVYYPYWLADYVVSANFDGEGKIVTHSSTSTHNITTTKHYHVVRDGDIEYRNVYRSALGKADRKLAEEVHPYRINEAVPFELPYLAGFMAEKRDMEAAAVREGVENELKGYAERILTSDAGYSSLSGRTNTLIKSAKYKYTLLPSWILTYKRGGETYYFAQNGQTSRMCGKLPVDVKKLLLHSALLGAAVLTALLAGGLFLW